jgi:hypothetical protein
MPILHWRTSPIRQVDSVGVLEVNAVELVLKALA